MKVESACARIEEQGYCVMEDLLDPREAARLNARARRLMQREKGYVNLEGALNPMPELAPLCVHPVVMEIAGHFLGAPFYLANNVCMKWCQPGAAGGHLHSDWPLLDVPRPFPPWPMLLQTMWMLTDFTAGKRRHPRRPGQPPERQAAGLRWGGRRGRRHRPAGIAARLARYPVAPGSGQHYHRPASHGRQRRLHSQVHPPPPGGVAAAAHRSLRELSREPAPTPGALGGVRKRDCAPPECVAVRR